MRLSSPLSFSGKVLFCSGKRPNFVSLFLKLKNNHGKLYGKSGGCLSDGASVWHTY